MHYYTKKIGDYRRDTMHLTLIEHGIYNQLIDSYYLAECAFPLDKEYIARKHKITTPDEFKALDNVLRDFFVELHDGYHHKRCDEELSSYLESKPERDKKRENERERKRRSREHRTNLFKKLREFNIIPRWDTKIFDLETMLANAINQPRDLSQPVTVTGVTGVDQNLNKTAHIQESDKDSNVSDEKVVKTDVSQDMSHCDQSRVTLGGTAKTHKPNNPITHILNNTQDSDTAGKSPESEPTGSDATKGTRKKFGSDKDHEVAKWIFEKCIKVILKDPKIPNWDTWANDVRLMVESDKRTHREICELFQWASKDPFWCQNILSPAKLRVRWDQLTLAKGRTPATKQATGPKFDPTAYVNNPTSGNGSHDHGNSPADSTIIDGTCTAVAEGDE